MSDQPMPKPGGVPVTPIARAAFLAMLAEREERGIATYGMSLTTDNGRDAVQDAMEEACDLWQYLVQIHLERADLRAENTRLRAENARLTGGAS